MGKIIPISQGTSVQPGGQGSTQATSVAKDRPSVASLATASGQPLSPQTGPKGAALSQAQLSYLQLAPETKGPERPIAGTRERRTLPDTFGQCEAPKNPERFNGTATSLVDTLVDTVQGGNIPTANAVRLASAAFGTLPFAAVQGFEVKIARFFQAAQSVGLFESMDVADVDAAIEAKFPDVISLLQQQVLGTAVSPEFGPGLAGIIQNLQLAAGQAAGASASSYCSVSLELPSVSCSALAGLVLELRGVVTDQVSPVYLAGLERVASALASISDGLEAQVHQADGTYKASVDGAVASFAAPFVAGTPSSDPISASRLKADADFSGIVGAPAEVDALYNSLKSLLRTVLTDPYIRSLGLAEDTSLLTAEVKIDTEKESDSGSEFNKLKARVQEKKTSTLISFGFIAFELICLFYALKSKPERIKTGDLKLIAQLRTDIALVAEEPTRAANEPIRRRVMVPLDDAQGGELLPAGVRFRLDHPMINLDFTGDWFIDSGTGQTLACIKPFKDNIDEAHNALKTLLPRASYNELFKHFEKLEQPSDLTRLYGNLRKFYSQDGQPQSGVICNGTQAEVNFTNTLSKLMNNLIRMYQTLYTQVGTNVEFSRQFLGTKEVRSTIRVFGDASRVRRAFFPADASKLTPNYSERVSVDMSNRNAGAITNLHEVLLEEARAERQQAVVRAAAPPVVPQRGARYVAPPVDADGGEDGTLHLPGVVDDTVA